MNYEETVAKIQETVDGYPGLYRDLLTYLRERIKEVLTGSSATIVIRLYGENLVILRDKAQEVYTALTDIEGVIDLQVQPQVSVPQVEVHVRPEKAAQFGLTAGVIRNAVNLLIKGEKVGEFYENQNIFDVVVWGAPETRTDLGALRSLMLDIPSGGVLSVLFSGGILSLGSLIGFVTVLGIAARNSIMLISHYRYLQLEDGQLFGMELVIQGAKERLAPILMTAMTTAG